MLSYILISVVFLLILSRVAFFLYWKQSTPEVFHLFCLFFFGSVTSSPFNSHAMSFMFPFCELPDLRSHYLGVNTVIISAITGYLFLFVSR